MPAVLPPNSACTYAIEFSADQVLDTDTTVIFSQPAIHYIENFLAFPVGAIVPAGSLDRADAIWKPSPNGRVVQILSINGGAAALDVDGSGQPADAATLAELDIAGDESRELAAIYAPGTGPLARYRSPTSQPGTTIGLGVCLAMRLLRIKEVQLQERLLMIHVAGPAIHRMRENQVLRETVPISGTPFALHYCSSAPPGYGFLISIGDSDLAEIRSPAVFCGSSSKSRSVGQFFVQEFPAALNLSHTFEWDGKDCYGRTLVGAQPAHIRRGVRVRSSPPTATRKWRGRTEFRCLLK